MNLKKLKKLFRIRRSRSSGGPHQRRVSSSASSSGASRARSKGLGTEARRARANAVVAADLKVRHSSAGQSSSRTASDTPSRQKVDNKSKPKKEFTTGRTVFPVVGSDGRTRYLPIASEATQREKKLGLFVDNNSVTKDPINTLLPGGKSVTDTLSIERRFESDGNIEQRVRTLFATETPDGKTEYLPKESEASAAELSQGKYVPDDMVESPPVGNPVLDKKPLFNFTHQRNLFATKAADGRTEYLPKKSDANSLELKEGRYVADDAISKQAPLGAANSMSNKKPRYDMGKGRKVFAVTTQDGGKIKTIYLPSASDATALEKARGLYIPDDIVDRHERKRRRTALKNDEADNALRRAQRADKLAGGTTAKKSETRPDPVIEAQDGTELWDGFSLPEVKDEKQRATLEKLRPKYDLGKDRMVYPVETAKGEIEYLPLQDDATTDERIDGRYAAFVPPEPLEDFLADPRNGIQRQEFDTEQGKVQAYTQADIKEAFESAPTLVLRSAWLVSEAARENPALQQYWM